MTNPTRELLICVADLRGLWSYLVLVQVVMSTSMIFELFEWGAAIIFGGDLGMAYLSTQGDDRDAHKDMTFASLGAVASMLIVAGRHVARRHLSR